MWLQAAMYLIPFLIFKANLWASKHYEISIIGLPSLMIFLWSEPKIVR